MNRFLSWSIYLLVAGYIIGKDSRFAPLALVFAAIGLSLRFWVAWKAPTVYENPTLIIICSATLLLLFGYFGDRGYTIFSGLLLASALLAQWRRPPG